MPNPTRRDFLKATTIAGGALLLTNCSRATPQRTSTPDKYITCFYQFTNQTLQSLSAPNGLPNGPNYLHIFSISHANDTPHPALARSVRACGPSFKYARAIDIWKYKDWQTASDDQLRRWSIAFRDAALPDDGPVDYFAFNEMPAGGESKPDLQRRIAQWMRYLHDPNDGRGPLPAVFYLVEENLDPKTWKTDAADELFAAVDETSAIVVGEHYHDAKFLAQHTPEQLTDHLFAFPKWLDASGKAPQQNIAQHKYAVLHSTYYGTETTDWQGLQQSTATPTQFKDYLSTLIAATRRSPYGRSRIAFGPLETTNLDTDDILPALTEVLHEDANKFNPDH